MTTEPTTAARADMMQLTDDEIDSVGGGFGPWPVLFGIGVALWLYMNIVNCIKK